jgi:hypothetical protein
LLFIKVRKVKIEDEGFVVRNNQFVNVFVSACIFVEHHCHFFNALFGSGVNATDNEFLRAWLLLIGAVMHEQRILHI